MERTEINFNLLLNASSEIRQRFNKTEIEWLIKVLEEEVKTR